MERRGSENRLKGIRSAAGTAVLAVSLAACGSNNATETQKPTILPTETPAPTMTIVPSESPMATPTPEITLTPTPEVTPTPAPTVDEVAESIISQEKNDIKKTDIEAVRAGVDSLWEKYGEQLSQVSWKDSSTGKLSKDYLMKYTDSIEKGLTQNAPSKQIIDERVGFSGGFIVTYLVAYDSIQDADAKAALARESDRIYDYAVTSIDPKNTEKSRDQLKRDITGLLEFYLH